MSSIPETLEQLIYEVLQGDLSQNPYLQPHVIASKDKSLKTQAKKIIPAINELLKRVGVCEETMQGFTSEVDKKITEELTQQLVALESSLQEKLEASYKEEIEKRFEALEKTVAENMSQQIQDQVQNVINASQSKGQGGSGDMKKTLVEKVIVPKGETVVIHSITQEELFPENIVVYQGATLLTSGTQQTIGGSGSVYTVTCAPLHVSVTEDGGIRLYDRNTQSDLTVLIYKYE